jgi:hypothetical protein
MRIRLQFVIVVGAALLAGCQSLIGPASIAPDRINYADAMADSWQQQMLLNIVKFRYFDTPVFLDVSSMISSYQIEGQASVGVNLLPKSASGTTHAGNTMVNLGVGGSYLEHPTITYAPLTGEKFVNALLKPLPPQTVMAMIASGHLADFILELSVDSINGVQNVSTAPLRSRVANPTFVAIADAFTRIQQAGAIGMRTETHGKEPAMWIAFSRTASTAVENDIRFVTTQLRLKSANGEYRLVYGSAPRKPDEIALQTRSMQQILIELGAGVDVPKQDLADHRATRVPASASAETGGSPLIRIHSSREQPKNAYTAVFYRDHWFWIDDRDLKSKRVFMFLLIFSSLAETGIVPQSMPILTIPAS